MSSWKTTSAGIISILIAVLTAGAALLKGQSVDFATTITAITAGVGLIMAKDNKPTGS